MNAQLEALRILIQANVMNIAMPGSLTQETLAMAGRTITQLAIQIQQELQGAQKEGKPNGDVGATDSHCGDCSGHADGNPQS